jgi:type 1 fimbriae regulatory protein FimB/type 1 fimbriae regulatory protein FimE
VHTLDRDEVSALRKLKAMSTSPYVFVSERGGPLSPDMIARIVARAAETAKLGFHVHPHMLLEKLRLRDGNLYRAAMPILPAA